MSLPFPDKNKKTYQCFCCGVQFDSLEDMKEHILEEHEEGRDYVICPYCEYPVRCIKTHCKVKHPHRPLPKVKQMRSVVWRDFNSRKKKKKPKFHEGYYESTKMKKKMYYRSSYEMQVYECLDADLEVLTFDAEPFKIPYIYEGKKHEYTPDIIIKYTDGSTKLIEIKPADQTSLKKNKAKWFAANQACKDRGWEFEVYTEKGIKLLKQKIQRQRQMFND